MLPFNPFSALTSKIYGALAIGAIVVAGAQTLRIEGAVCRDAAAGEYSRCLVKGYKQRIDDRDAAIGKLTRAVEAERDAHRQTKLNYKKAQDDAAALETQRLARVKAEQEEITDEVRADFASRLAGARAAAERLRSDAARTGERPAGAGAAEPVPTAGDAAGRADGEAADRGLSPAAEDLEWRLVATEQALQLDALITFLERQRAVDAGQ